MSSSPRVLEMRALEQAAMNRDEPRCYSIMFQPCDRDQVLLAELVRDIFTLRLCMAFSFLKLAVVHISGRDHMKPSSWTCYPHPGLKPVISPPSNSPRYFSRGSLSTLRRCLTQAPDLTVGTCSLGRARCPEDLVFWCLCVEHQARYGSY